MLPRIPKNHPLALEMIAGIALAAMVLTATAAVIFWAFERIVFTGDSVKHTSAVLTGAGRARAAGQEAYISGSGYLLTGDTDQLTEHTRAVEELFRQLDSLKPMISDERQQQRLMAIAATFESWRQGFQTPRAPRDPMSSVGAQEAEATLKGVFQGPGDLSIRGEIRQTWEAFLVAEQKLLVTRSAEHENAIRIAKLATAGGPILALLVIILSGFRQVVRLRRNLQMVTTAARDVAAGDRSRRAELPQIQEVRALASAFNDMAGALEEREREAALLHELVDLLAACRNLEEAGEAAAAIGKQLFPSGGGFFLANNSHSSVEPLVSWGAVSSKDCLPFHPDDCWALRRGQTFGSTKGGPGTLRCRHIADDPKMVTLCVPLVAQGDAVSLMQLCWPAGDVAGAPRQDLIHAFSEQLALALANVRLRERLLAQSVRDPLTGLFNRRYLDETLERELARARRNKLSIGFLMLDVDHFKLFNDNYGHGGGDALLQSLGGAMMGYLRREDIACRYGGEEFVLVLPGASLADSQRRAEQLRETLGRLSVTDQGRVLGPISVSIGVSAFPDHGAEADVLIRLADVALYEAKSRGRNQVAVSGVGSDSAVPLLATVGNSGRTFA